VRPGRWDREFESALLQGRVYKLSVPGHVGQPTTGRTMTGSGHFTRNPLPRPPGPANDAARGQQHASEGNRPLCDLLPQILRGGARASIQFAAGAARGLRSLHHQPAARRLGMRMRRMFAIAAAVVGFGTIVAFAADPKGPEGDQPRSSHRS